MQNRWNQVYNKFIHDYKNFKDICDAGKKTIVEQLSSLGLKWRLEHIHRISCIIQRDYKGKVPENKEKLLSLDGIGPYISSAVINFAFDKPEPILDTNTVRVIGRIFGLEINDSSRRKKIFETIMGDLVNFESHKMFLWSLIDLAAIVCRPVKPSCDKCPLNRVCIFYGGMGTNEEKNS